MYKKQGNPVFLRKRKDKNFALKNEIKIWIKNKIILLTNKKKLKNVSLILNLFG